MSHNDKNSTYTPPQQKHQQAQKPKETIKHYLKIVYEDATKTVAQSIIEIPDYDNLLCYRGNIEGCLEEIYQAGGFWLNETTMIPYTRIYSLSTHIIKEEPVKPPKQQNRRTNRGNRHRGNKPDKKSDDKKANTPPSPGILNLS